MNASHLTFLASPEWKQMLETDLLPWLADVADLGDDVLEIGPGPGLTTDLLRVRTAKLTAIEIDADLAAALAARLAGTNVDVIHGDATASGLPSDRFSAATSFSVLHHMPSPDLQDRLFAELHRMLRPAGVLAGVVKETSTTDVFVPVDPATLGTRLGAAGFADVETDIGDYQFRFCARKAATGG